MLGTEDTYIGAYISHFQKQFDKISDADFERQIGTPENVKAFAVSINETVKKKIARKRAEQKQNSYVNKTQAGEEGLKYKKEHYFEGPDSSSIKIDSINSSPSGMTASTPFKLKFALLLPFIVCLYIIVTLGIILAEAVLIALIAICGLICIAAAIGCIALPIIGIYYGITIMRENRLQGLYEIGLGVFALGACFGMAVIFYVITVKLLPMAVSKCKDLLPAFYNAGRRIYNNAKDKDAV